MWIQSVLGPAKSIWPTGSVLLLNFPLNFSFNKPEHTRRSVRIRGRRIPKANTAGSTRVYPGRTHQARTVLCSNPLMKVNHRMYLEDAFSQFVDAFVEIEFSSRLALTQLER